MVVHVKMRRHLRICSQLPRYMELKTQIQKTNMYKCTVKKDNVVVSVQQLTLHYRAVKICVKTER